MMIGWRLPAKKRRYSLFVIRWQLKAQALKSCNQHKKTMFLLLTNDE